MLHLYGRKYSRALATRGLMTYREYRWRRVSGEASVTPSYSAQRNSDCFSSDAPAKQFTMSAELIFRINKLLRRTVVDRIEFRIAPHALGRGTAKGVSAPRVREPLPTAVVSSAAEIQDAELRERFMRAASNCIERRDSTNSAIRNSQSEI